MPNLPLESWLALGLAALCVGSVGLYLYLRLRDLNR